MASGDSEGEMEQAQIDEKMVLEEETSRCEVAVHRGDRRTTLSALKEERF